MNKIIINNSKIKKEVNQNKANEKISDDMYKVFTDRILNEDLANYSEKELKELYDKSQGLMNEYYITHENLKMDQEKISKLQYAAMSILYNLNLKTEADINKRIKQQEQISNIMKKQAKIISRDNRIIKQEMKTIIVTIIAIVLAISIIPTAIAGIEKINSNYILSFLSSVVLFGILMIAFVFSIYNINLKKKTLLLIYIFIAIFIITWLLSWKIDISMKPKEISEACVYVRIYS